MILFFDTETTGLIDFKADLMAAHQPRIVQLAAELCNEAGEVVESLNSIIKPNGWDSIEEKAFEAHGITIERCHDEGRCMKEVLAEFNAIKAKATKRAAYNIPYDKKMMAREAGYHGIEHNSDGIESYCVMKMSTPIVNMPPTAKMKSAGFGWKPKSPKLIEAYRHFFRKDFDAHDAMNDVRATREIFFVIRDQYPDYFKPEAVKPKYEPELALRPVPASAGRDDAESLTAF